MRRFEGKCAAKSGGAHQFGVLLLGGDAGGGMARVLQGFWVQGVVARALGRPGLVRGHHVGRVGSNRLEGSSPPGSGVDPIMWWWWWW